VELAVKYWGGMGLKFPNCLLFKGNWESLGGLLSVFGVDMFSHNHDHLCAHVFLCSSHNLFYFQIESNSRKELHFFLKFLLP